MDDETYGDIPARGRLAISLLEGDINRLRKCLERLEGHLHSLKDFLKND